MTKRKENILVLLPDSAQKYLSKIFDDKWMRENGFLDDESGLGTVNDILQAKGKRKIVSATPQSKVKDVIATLKSLGISQLPVLEKGKLRGIIGEVDLLRHLVTGQKKLDSTIGELVEGEYTTVTPETKIELLQGVLAEAKVAIAMDGEEVVGIVTKIDLIDYLAKKPPADSAVTKKRVVKKATTGKRARSHG